MKITNINTEIKYISLKTPFITALRRVENIEFVRVTIECDNGFKAIGEAPATKAITGEGIEEILDSLVLIKEKLYSKTLKIALDIVHNDSIIKSSAKASLDMALISLLSYEKSLPLYQYLGLNKPVILYTDVTVSLKSTQEMLQDSIKAYKNGMPILKVKLGHDILHAIEVTTLISNELPLAKLLIDANQAWSVEETLKFIESMKHIKIELIEQPVIASDLEGLKIITQNSHIPILADEAVFTLEDVKKVMTSGSADMINIKLMKCGGITKAVEILEYARDNGIKCMLGSMLEGSYSINAALHLGMAYSDVIYYIDLDSPLLYKEESTQLDFKFYGSKIVYTQFQKQKL